MTKHLLAVAVLGASLAFGMVTSASARPADKLDSTDVITKAEQVMPAEAKLTNSTSPITFEFTFDKVKALGGGAVIGVRGDDEECGKTWSTCLGVPAGAGVDSGGLTASASKTSADGLSNFYMFSSKTDNIGASPGMKSGIGISDRFVDTRPKSGSSETMIAANYPPGAGPVCWICNR